MRLELDSIKVSLEPAAVKATIRYDESKKQTH